jgi:hypothetical protein
VSRKHPQGTSIQIVQADKMSALLSDDQLAAKVRDIVRALRLRLEELRPLVIELRSRFETLRKGKTGTPILGCHTWEQFCQQQLHYTDRHVRRLIQSQNLASETFGNKGSKSTKAALKTSGATGAEVRDPERDDEEYVSTCVRFVTSTLLPLESDSERFRRVARAIAKEIVDALDDDDDEG